MIIVLALCTACTVPGQVRIASWNLNNLHHTAGQSLRTRAPVRDEDDYSILRTYVERVAADLIAFQEVNGAVAARLLFPDSTYQVFVSGRHAANMDAKQDANGIYTGFAVRRGIFDRVEQRDYPGLNVSHGRRQVRWGTELIVERNQRRLHLLNIHLKSRCSRGSLEPATDPNCVTLAKQRAPLENWIDSHAARREPFIVLGDFNRAFDIHRTDDHMWRELDDDEPPGLILRRLPFKRDSRCWRGTANHHRFPIDFFVFGQRSWGLVVEESFRELTYDRAHRDERTRMPSDHCPIVVELMM